MKQGFFLSFLKMNVFSYQLELLQANPKCVHEESSFLKNRKGISYSFSFHPENTPLSILARMKDDKPKVAGSYEYIVILLTCQL